MIPFPNKKYKIIYADPPWQYDDPSDAGKRGARYKYKTMTIDEICSLPVPEIADEDCTLFLWSTGPQNEQAFKVIKAWGFEYKTWAFAWIKLNPRDVWGSYFMGMGNWTRANIELVLLATKGNPKRINADVRQIVLAPIEEHSKKPAIIRDNIVSLMGNLPRIELFARQRVPGWDAWGDEI